MTLIEHVSDDRWARELAKVTEPRRPPVPVSVWLSLDGRAWPGELHGWAVDPMGAGGLLGLTFLVRESAPGFQVERLHWDPAHHITRRDS